MKRYSDRQSELVTDLHAERLDRVLLALLESHAESVLDLGCGTGELLLRLVEEKQFKRIVGIDSSREALAEARAQLARHDNVPAVRRISLQQASFTCWDEELSGFDAAVLLETIEHVESHRLSAVEQAVFAGCRPQTIVITTPNQEYNVLHGIPPGAFRHPEHRFEWTRAKFRNWAEGVAGRNGYRARFDDVGAVDRVLGGSTQMATFSRA